VVKWKEWGVAIVVMVVVFFIILSEGVKLLMKPINWDDVRAGVALMKSKGGWLD